MYKVSTSLFKFVHVKNLKRVINKINKDIEKDKLWHGRFIVNLCDSRLERYSDLSGACLHFYYEIVDKKTNYRMLKYANESTFVNNDLRRAVNNFIVEDVKINFKDPDVKNDDYDYSTIEVEHWKWKDYKKKSGTNYFFNIVIDTNNNKPYYPKEKQNNEESNIW